MTERDVYVQFKTRHTDELPKKGLLNLLINVEGTFGCC